MAQKRSTEIKVGIFMAVCLVVVAVMIIRFGKYTQVGEKTYQIFVVFPNVGGIVKDAGVMYAGIPVGKVREIRLKEDGTLKAQVTLAIYQDVHIRKDAKFVINQSGLLGDRYVDVIPQTTTAEVIKPGEVVEGSSSVDLTEAIRSVVDVLRAAGSTIERVDQAIRRIDQTVLSPASLSHVSNAFANVDHATSNAVAATSSLRDVIEDNRPRVDSAMTRISDASQSFDSAAKRADRLVARVDDLVATNQDEVAVAVKNLAESTARLNALLERVEKGEGTVGKLMTDATLHDEIVRLVQNWRRYGLLYKEGAGADAKGKTVPPKPARPATKAEEKLIFGTDQTRPAK